MTDTDHTNADYSTHPQHAFAAIVDAFEDDRFDAFAPAEVTFRVNTLENNASDDTPAFAFEMTIAGWVFHDDIFPVMEGEDLIDADVTIIHEMVTHVLEDLDAPVVITDASTTVETHDGTPWFSVALDAVPGTHVTPPATTDTSPDAEAGTEPDAAATADIHPDVARHENVVTTDSGHGDSDPTSVAAELRALADRIEGTDARISSFEHERIKPHQLTEDDEWVISDTCYHTLFCTARVDNPNGGEVRKTTAPDDPDGGLQSRLTPNDTPTTDPTSVPFDLTDDPDADFAGAERFMRRRDGFENPDSCSCGPDEACDLCGGGQ